MVNIISKKTEEKLNLFFDLDGTLKDHSAVEIALYKILIPSTINRTDSLYRKILTTASNIYIPLSKAKAFEDTSSVVRESSSFASNYLYTLNSEKTIKYFLEKNNLQSDIGRKIALPFKNPEILSEMLSKYQETPENSVAVLFGDTMIDLENNYNGKVIKVGFGGPLERKKEQLKNLSDIYIPEVVRKNKIESLHRIYSGLESELDGFGVSKKQSIRKNITSLKEKYEAMLEIHF